jgi:hypothetical protein
MIRPLALAAAMLAAAVPAAEAMLPGAPPVARVTFETTTHPWLSLDTFAAGETYTAQLDGRSPRREPPTLRRKRLIRPSRRWRFRWRSRRSSTPRSRPLPPRRSPAGALRCVPPDGRQSSPRRPAADRLAGRRRRVPGADGGERLPRSSADAPRRMPARRGRLPRPHDRRARASGDPVEAARSGKFRPGPVGSVRRGRYRFWAARERAFGDPGAPSSGDQDGGDRSRPTGEQGGRPWAGSSGRRRSGGSSSWR